MRGKKTFNTPEGAPNHAESVDLSSKGISKRKFLADSKAIQSYGRGYCMLYKERPAYIS